MKYLLDTHIVLWSLFEPDRLAEKQKTAILDMQNDIFVSAISFWEISLKYALKKLSLGKTKPEKIPEYVKKSGFKISNLNIDLLATFHNLPVIAHKDPFDRMLIWEAINRGYTMITKDKSFSEYRKLGLKIL